MDNTDASKIRGTRNFLRPLLTGALSLVFLSLPLQAENDARRQTEPFPNTAALFAAVLEREAQASLGLGSCVFKDKVTVSALDAKGRLRTTQMENRYFDMSEYHPFSLHITTNEKSLNIPFSEILGKSRLVPLQWSTLGGMSVIVFSYEPQSPVAKHGDLENRLAGDLKGRIWVSPSDSSIVRFEFRTVLPISLGRGYLGSIDSLEGFLQMREASANVWLPTRQEFVTQGKNGVVVVVGFRFSKKFRTQQTDELSRYAPDFDFVNAEPSLVHFKKVAPEDSTAVERKR